MTDSVPNRLRLCFVGTLNFKPNILAIEFLVDEIWPLVRSVYPEAEPLIAGRTPYRQSARTTGDPASWSRLMCPMFSAFCAAARFRSHQCERGEG